MAELPENIEQLISERNDGGLSPAQIAEVKRVVASDPRAVRVAQAYEGLDRMLRRFRALPDHVDHTAFRDTLSARVADEVGLHASASADSIIDPSAHTIEKVTGHPTEYLGRQFQRIDELLQCSHRPMPKVDWGAFHARVSVAVQEKAKAGRRSRIVRWALRAGVPLAAAAAIFMTVRQPGVEQASPLRKTAAPSKIVSVAFDSPRENGVVAVSFDTTPAPVQDTRTDSPGIAIASGTVPTPVVDSTEVALLF